MIANDLLGDASKQLKKKNYIIYLFLYFFISLFIYIFIY